MLFFIVIFKITILNAQHAKNIIILGNDISYKLDSGYYDLELRVGMPKVLVKKSIFSKRTNKMVEEIIKISDTSVCYIKYDEKLNVIATGLLLSDKSQAIDIKTTLPDFLNDPSGDKGLMYDNISSGWLPLDKEGYWVENRAFKKSNSMEVGYYKNGRRNGDWNLGYLMNN